MTSEVRGDTEELVGYPDPPEYLAGNRINVGALLKVFGPGAIIASVTIGSGETIFSARGGAIFSYAIIWTLVVAALAKGAMVYATNRYMTVAGEHPMTRWATLFPGPRGWFPLLIGVVSILAFPSWAAGLSLAIGDLMALITSVSTGQIWATVLLVLAAALAWAGGYGPLEKAQTIILGLMLISLAVSVFVIGPDWLGALGGLVPQMPEYAGWLQQEYEAIAARPIWLEVATYLGAIGGGTYDYIGYTGMLREKKWGLLGRSDSAAVAERFAALPKGARLPIKDQDDEVRKARAWSRAPLGDTGLAFVAITIFAIMFAINGAALLHAQHLVPAEDNTLTHQAQFLGSIGPAFEYLYYVAIFFAFFGSLYGFWELYSYTTYETIGAVFPKVRAAGQRKIRVYVYPYVFIVGMLLLWTIGEVVVIVTPASVVGGVLMCGVFCLAVLWTEKKMLPKALRISAAGWWYVLVSGLLLVVLGIISTWQLFA